jgi:hypothetical protein
MKKKPSLLLLSVLVGILSVADAWAQLVLYDSFVGNTIDPSKWSGGEAAGTAPAPTTETIRKIVGGKLQLQQTFYGNTSSDVGAPTGGTQRLRITDPSGVGAIQAKVAVQKAEAPTCATNAGAVRSRTQLFGAFFNDGSSTGAGDQTGDIESFIEMRLDNSGNRRIRGQINRCDDATCSVRTTLLSVNFVTTWTKGAAKTLRIQWDPANDQFIYTVNPGTAKQEVQTLSYNGIVTDADPAGADRKEIRLNNDPVNCTAGRIKVVTQATFDNVMLGP